MKHKIDLQIYLLVNNKLKVLNQRGKTKPKCKAYKESVKNNDDLNEHYEMELFCITCVKCIIGYYENITCVAKDLKQVN